jgi:hypothetical protein
MAGESSFDVVSDFDDMEMRNALDQVRREVQQRYDFKGATFDLSQAKTELILLTDDEFRAKAIRDLIESKAVRRGLSLKVFDWGKFEPAAGQEAQQAHPRRVSEGQVPDPGRRPASLRQEQGRSAGCHCTTKGTG